MQFLTKRIGTRFRHFSLQDDVASIGVKFLRNLGPRKFQLSADKICSRVDVGQMGRVGDDRFDRDVVRENFVVSVENCAAFGKDRLLNYVLFSGESGVLVVLDHLEVDQAKGKRAEEQNEAEADDCTSCSAVPFHLAPR